MAGQLTIAPFAAVTIDPGQDGDVNWELNPFGNPTWGQDFRSGSWIEDLVAAYLAGGPEADGLPGQGGAARGRLAAGAARVRPGPADAGLHRAGVPRPVVDQRPDPADRELLRRALDGRLEPRADAGHQAARASAAATRRRAFGGDALRWRQTAVAQLTAAFEPNRLGPGHRRPGRGQRAGDAVRELRLRPVADRAARARRRAAIELPGWITARIAKLPAFLGYATEPDGDLVQIGDTYVERPATSPRGDALVAVYPQAGYVFGRSGWTPAASFYSLRFGPGTGDPRPRRPPGRHLLRAGPRPHRRRRRTTATPPRRTVPGCSPPRRPARWCCRGCRSPRAAATSLVADRIGQYGQFYELYDTAFGGDPRYPLGLRQPAAGPDARLRPGRGRLGHVRLPAAMAPGPGPAGDRASGRPPRSRTAPGTKLTLARVAAARPGHPARLDAGGPRPDRPVPGLGVASDAAAHPGRRRDDDQHRTVRRASSRCSSRPPRPRR